MKKLRFTTYITLLILAFCLTSMKTITNDPIQTPLNCPDTPLTFTNDIKPIFKANCTKCHNSNEKAGYNFHKLEFVKKAVNSDKLLKAIKHLDGAKPMPRYAPFLKYARQLDQKDIDKIECWINNGMKE